MNIEELLSKLGPIPVRYIEFESKAFMVWVDRAASMMCTYATLHEDHKSKSIPCQIHIDSALSMARGEDS